MILFLLGAPIGYLISEIKLQEIARLRELGMTANISALTLQALLAMDTGCFFSLVGLAVVTARLVRYLRTRITS